MGQLILDATLSAAPAVVTDASFPAGSSEIPFTTTTSPKTYAVETGKAFMNVPGTYADLPGIGAGASVQSATFLYLRSNAPILVRITQAGSTPGAPQVIPVLGVLVMEPSPGAEITLVEVQGGGQVEYYACGNS